MDKADIVSAVQKHIDAGRTVREACEAAGVTQGKYYQERRRQDKARVQEETEPDWSPPEEDKENAGTQLRHFKRLCALQRAVLETLGVDLEIAFRGRDEL